MVSGTGPSGLEGQVTRSDPGSDGVKKTINVDTNVVGIHSQCRVKELVVPEEDELQEFF
jgi:hypothetical protein